MINNAVERFRINHENDANYEVYYKNANGSYWYYSVNYNKKGIAIISPSRRTTKTASETSKPYGIVLL